MKLNVFCVIENSESTIAECIKSIQNQYFTNFKVILVDNNSSDSSNQIVSELIKNDNRFSLVKNNVKKFYVNNLLENLKDNRKISWNDIILQIDPDEKLIDYSVFGLITKLFMNENNWVYINSNSKKNIDSFRNDESHIIDFSERVKIFRSFLLRTLSVNQSLILESEKYKVGKINLSLPILEMTDPKHIIYFEEILEKVNLSKISDDVNQINQIKSIVSKLPLHEKVNLIQNTVFKTSSISYPNSLDGFDIKKKSILPNIQDQNLKTKVEESKSDPILEPKIDLNSIVPPKKLNELLENKLTKPKEVIIEKEIEKVEISVIKKSEYTSSPDQKNIIIQKVLEKRKSSIPQPQKKKEEIKEVKKLNQINYSNLNSIFEKKPNIKIDKKSNDLKKNTNQRNEVFEIKQRQVHREIKLPKPNLSETKPKANIKIR